VSPTGVPHCFNCVRADTIYSARIAQFVQTHGHMPSNQEITNGERPYKRQS